MKRNAIVMLDEERERAAAGSSPSAARIRRVPPLSGSAAEGLTCRECGSIVDKLYQNDTCRGCLMKSFTRCIDMINQYRSGGGRERKA